MMILSMISDDAIESCVVQEKEQPKKSPVPKPRLFVKKLGKLLLNQKSKRPADASYAAGVTDLRISRYVVYVREGVRKEVTIVPLLLL